MRYLKSSTAPSVRKTNFAMMGTNIQPPGNLVYPCVIRGLNICAQIFVQQQVCEDEDGVWYGPGGNQPVFTSCCQVSSYLQQQDPPTTVTILPDTQQTVRNDRYKLVALTGPDCTNGGEATTQEFYRIDQSARLPKLDNAPSNLLAKPRLTPDERTNFQELNASLAKLVNSEKKLPRRRQQRWQGR